MLGLVISTVVSVLIFNFIDPEAAITLKEKTIDATVQMMRNFDTPENVVNETVEKMREQPNQFSLGNLFKQLAIQLVIFSVIGLIASLIMKKSDENA